MIPKADGRPNLVLIGNLNIQSQYQKFKLPTIYVNY